MAKKPISSQKSKSLENINKTLGKHNFNKANKAIIEIYQKQYLQKE